MTLRKNLFLVGRRRNAGDENQLTEMLAYLFQERRQLVPAWLRSLGLEADDQDPWEVETQRAIRFSA